MAGRPALPTNVKKLRGTAQPCRINENELEHNPLGNFPDPPENLTDGAKKQWYVILSAAENMGYLSAIAIPQLERYITLWESYFDAWEHCHDKAGKLKLVLKAGQVYRRNPYYDIMMSVSVEMRQIEVQWGWTPSSQSKVSSRKEDENEYDEFDI